MIGQWLPVLAVGLTAVSAQSPPPYKEIFFNQTLDHFSFVDTTFQHRYLVNDEHWTGKGALHGGCRGPILFYTGNEGSIEGFWAASGFVNSFLAAKWGALAVFAEHRYYGKSMPFGSKSLTTPDHSRFLSTEQALADYANLLAHLKSTLDGAANCPVVAFGGSYGGTLTAYFRAKYPNVIVGGLAASAPIGYYDPAEWTQHGVDSYTWINIVNKVYDEAEPNCLSNIESTTRAIATVGSTEEGRATLQKVFGLCHAPSSAQEVVNLWTDTVESVPQLNYPYAVGTLPPWPVNAACKIIAPVAQKDTHALLAAAAELMSWYYGSKASGECISAIGNGGVPGGGPPGLGDGFDSWGFQSCTETLHQFDAHGVRNFSFSLPVVAAACEKAFGVSPRPLWTPLHFGGYGLSDGRIGATNIIFSNGLLDPWHGGGFLNVTAPRCHRIIMPHGAHHLDLRAPNDADPADVTAARQEEERIIRGWIDAHAATFQ